MPGNGLTSSPQELLAETARSCPELTDALLVDGQGVLVARFTNTAAREKSLRGAAPAAPTGRPKGRPYTVIDAGVDPDELAGEALAIAPAIARAAGAGRIGAPVEWVIVGDKGKLVIRRLAELDLHLVLRVPPGAWIGRARFAARVAAGRIAQALAPNP